MIVVENNAHAIPHELERMRVCFLAMPAFEERVIKEPARTLTWSF
jgi:hypothetical protein